MAGGTGRDTHLLAHSTLVGVSGGLVVMWVRDETSHHSQHSEGLNFQMSGVRHTLSFI